jgi:hypothetical protein
MIQKREDVKPAMERRGLPGHMVEGVERYLFDGIPPGGFLTAILCNNLKESVKRADTHNILFLKEWAEFMINDLPGTSQGSEKKVKEWLSYV